MAQVVSHRLVTLEAQAHFQISPSDICGGQSGTETGFSLSIFVSLRLCHSTNALHPSSSTFGSYHEGKWANFGKLPESYALSKIVEH